VRAPGRAAALAGALSLAVGALDAASAAVSPDLFNLIEPAPGVYVHTGRALSLDEPGHDDIANIGFIVGRRCVAVVDTGGSVRIGRALRVAIRGRTALPVCYVINTHVHVDHLLGNAAFVPDHPKFVGHAALAAAVTRSRAFFVKQYPGDLDPPADENQVIGPDQPVTTELTLDLGDRPVRLHAWPTAHTDCDLTVYDVPTATLWTGDLSFRDRLPALDGSIRGWLAAIDELASLKAQWVVPGHGGLTRSLAEALLPERRYLEALLEGVRSELREGRSMQDAIERIDYAGKSQWLLYDQVHPRNVARAYQELEWE
jgi:quinoprotein relay system zinc metallohydrolase 2